MNKKNIVIRIGCVIVASFVMALNMNSFVSAGGLIPGGFNGLSILLQRVALTYFELDIPYSMINLSLNAIPAYIGFKIIGRKFTMFSIATIILTSTLVDILPVYTITEDILLICIFGGIINGFSILVALQGGASSGGTDFIAMAISQKTNESAWNYILTLNALIILVGGALFGWDKALYSIIFQFCSTQVVQTMHNQYKKLTVFIVCKKPREIMDAVMNATHHGFTCLEGYGGYSNEPRTMLYTVIGKDELKIVRQITKEIDPGAFINVTKTAALEGRFYKAPID